MKFIRHAITIVLILSLICGCATAPRKRFFIGATVGGAAGGIGGAVLSPNNQSRGLNALVFGLVGALIGGLGSLFFHDDAEIPETEKKTSSKATQNSPSTEMIAPQSDQPLPEFVRKRLKQVVIEQLTEPDTVSEDGSLHEPHKVYRIKQQAELFAKPIESDSERTKK